MTRNEQTQVLIAGGGPVGLFAAVCAAQCGLDVIVLERNFRGTPRGHTTLLHPSSMRLLAELGLAPLLLREGLLLERLELRVNADTRLLELPFPALSITQAVLEEALLQVLRKQEVDLRATYELTRLDQDQLHVKVKAVHRERTKAASLMEDERWETVDSATIQARFVIGADGRASTVRQSLGIRTATNPTERYAMFEFPCAPTPDPRLLIDDEHSSFVSPLVTRRARCSFQLSRDQHASADLALLTTLLRTRAPGQTIPSELHWSGIVDFEPAVAEAFGRDRVWLVGDAAHTVGPLGVHSMNRGLREAWRLIEAMAAVSAGKHSLESLELLAGAQRRDWLRALAKDAHFELLPRAPSWLSQHAHRIVSALPVSGPDLDDVLGQLGMRLSPTP